MLSRPRGYEAVFALPPNAAVNAAARSVAGRAWRYRLVVVSCEWPMASLIHQGVTEDVVIRGGEIATPGQAV
jgi:hypothetical protein